MLSKDQILQSLFPDFLYIICVHPDYEADGTLKYVPKSFIRNSRDFGVPQNRPRTYIIGFDTERFAPERLAMLPTEMPRTRAVELYHDLNDLLEHDVPARYYMASGYLETLVKHRERQEGKGYGFGYRIVNAEGIERPIANTLLATGGSGRERNLIYDSQENCSNDTPNNKCYHHFSTSTKTSPLTAEKSQKTISHRTFTSAIITINSIKSSCCFTIGILPAFLLCNRFIMYC